MDINTFEKFAKELIDWIVQYYKNIEEYSVKSQAKPREIYNKIPDTPPQNSEPFEQIFKDFQDIILPGITHWQSPKFFAYFPANTSFPSILGEMLTSAIAAQCMKWETSPSATELEEKVLDWLRDMIGLPKNFKGVIQDTASTSTLVSILCARENFSNFSINESGFDNNKFRVYCSTETHSSIEKAVKISGIGKSNLVKISVDSKFSLIPDLLKVAIENDLAKGYNPLCVIATIGTTGSTAVDPLNEIGKICREYNIWLHIDAAFLGSALILPEYKWMLDGIENADSFVFNPHKWLFTNFDCSAYFVKDIATLIRTFEIIPEYLRTTSDAFTNNYCDWGIQLGRRFRALKLWFVIRSYGVNGLKEKLRFHISLAKKFETILKQNEEFEILAPVVANLVCFRYKPKNISDEESLNRINELLLSKINQDGKIYLSHTKLNGKYTLRMVIGQTNVQETHIEEAYKIILETIRSL
ncbi:MAG: pyridoxal-dependent decarboxylase [Ignavibacteria bacterium]|nr:pyridoxal-dependent decarboxylase [Ignavibacteria bacterium]